MLKRHIGFAVLFSLVAGLAVSVGVAPSAQAALKLELSDGVSTGSVVDTDGDGLVSFIGPVGMFSINVAAGLSKPAIGNAAASQMHLSALTMSGGGTGTLTIKLSDIDFSYLGGMLQFVTSFGGAAQGDVSLMAFIDTGNNEFGVSGPGVTKIADFSSFGPKQIGNALLDPDYSITLVATITHSSEPGKALASSLDASVEVPEPGTLMLFGIGLLALGTFYRRRRAPAQAA